MLTRCIYRKKRINFNQFILAGLLFTTFLALWAMVIQHNSEHSTQFGYANQFQSANGTSRISLLMVYERNTFFDATFRLSLANHYAYSRANGYGLVCRMKRAGSPGRPVAWMKVNATLEAFRANKADWLFWTDVDGLIMNHSIKLESFLQDVDASTDIIITNDTCNQLNTGHMLIRKSQWAIDFMERVYAKQWVPNWQLFDNAAIIYWYKNSETDRHHFKVIPDAYLMNAYVYPCARNGTDHQVYERGDFVVHFAGRTQEEKVNLVRKYAELSQQLNVYSVETVPASADLCDLAS